MSVFWKLEPLTPPAEKLLSLTLAAHAESAMRDNISSAVLTQAAIGSLDLTKSLTAALATLGGVHAPLAETYTLLQQVIPGEFNYTPPARVPGWGNSFVKGQPDPTWRDVDVQLGEVAPEIYKALVLITGTLHDAGKLIYPNPSAYTAAVGMALGMPAHLLSWLFVQGRLASWSLLFQAATKGVL
jgi:citrate synthase